MGSFEDVIKVAESWVVANGLTYLTRFIGAAVLFVAGRWGATLLSSVLTKAMRSSHVDETLVRFFGHVISITVIVVAVLASLDLIGVHTTSLVAILGAAGLAIGLAMQGSLSNFAAGVLIVLFRPFRVGDVVDIAANSGRVAEISIFTTTLQTLDNRQIIIPNSSITTGIITNHTVSKTRRLEILLFVGYKQDLKIAREAVMRVIENEKRVLTEPKPVVGVSKLNETGVDLLVWAWVTFDDLNELTEIKLKLNEAFKHELVAAGS